MKVTSLKGFEELKAYVSAWKDLAANAAEDNVFYEHWMLIPALQYLSDSDNPEILLIHDGDLLCGVVPVQKQERYKNFPFPHYQLWRHRHCYLCTPLLREGKETDVVLSVMDWVKSQGVKPKLMLWNWVGDGGVVSKAIQSACRSRKWTFNSLSFPRATFPGAKDPETYLDAALSGRHQREFSRIERRLSEKGTMVYEKLEPSGSIDAWMSDFLDLEASGWKGKAGTALKCNPNDEGFFRSVVKYAFDQGNLALIASRLAGKPLAMKCDFYSKKTGFSFKISFDEQHSKNSPGVLLHIWQIRQLKTMNVDFIDSCAEPGHTMIDRIWTGRRNISTKTVALGSLRASLLVRLFPKAKRIYQRVKALRKK